jgi:hypothetical protein
MVEQDDRVKVNLNKFGVVCRNQRTVKLPHFKHFTASPNGRRLLLVLVLEFNSFLLLATDSSYLSFILSHICSSSPAGLTFVTCLEFDLSSLNSFKFPSRTYTSST